MSTRSRTATIAGVLFLITEVSAIAGLALYQPALTDTGCVTGAGSDGRILLGVVCELILVVAVTGTAVTLFPVIKRQHEGIALGHVALRLLEAAVITVGMVSMLGLVTLRQDGVVPGGSADAVLVVGQALVAVHDWTFLLGPSVFLGLNSVLLAYLVHRARLVPRGITWLGLLGGPLVATSAVAVILGAYGPVTHAITAVPVFAWEVSLAVYLIAKGFRSAPADVAVASPADYPARRLAEAVQGD